MKSKINKRIKSRLTKAYRNQIARQVVRMSNRDIWDECSGLPKICSNDKLFSVGDVNDPILNKDLSLNLQSYQDGYIGTAITLLDLIKISKSIQIKDSYIYVALFCFRQYVELTIKDSLMAYHSTDINVQSLGHNILEAYDELMKIPLIEKDNRCKGVRDMLNSLCGIDPSGTVFRYGYKINSRNGKLSSTYNSRRGLISVKKLRMCMLQMYDFFEGISWMIYDNKQNQIQNNKTNQLTI